MTDTKIENGGQAIIDSGTNEVKLKGIDAIVQRIQMALSVKKGTFPYNFDMGIDYTALDFTQEKNLKILEMLINECVYPIWDCKIKVLSFDEQSNSAEILIDFNNDMIRTEVMLNGQL
jgi:hypothetical protein